MVGVAAAVVAAAAGKEMDDEPSMCNPSLAVDCTLSLGFALSRTADAPAARLSRAGSPDPDLALSLSLRSERVERRAVEHERSDPDVSWGSSCIRSDSEATPEYYPPVPEPVARVSDGARKSFKAWPQSPAHSPKALFATTEPHKQSHRANHQPWLSSYLSSSVVEDAKATSRADPSLLDTDSFARVCAHCGTSKTPLWRNGPGGPKSLCNACGIRFKKAGRRSAANGGSDSPVSPPPKATKRSHEQELWADAKARKRSRAADSVLFGSCMTWQSSPLCSSPKSPLQRDFPASPPSEREPFSSDEEEGAVLLMALSCGMVNA